MTRVGIVGAGFMGMVHYLTYQKLANVEVVAICDSNPKRLTGDWTDNIGDQYCEKREIRKTRPGQDVP